MHDAARRGVIRLGDSTDHGGQVKSAFDGLMALGRPVAGEGCVVWCPKCKGEFAILPAPSGRRHHGKTLAYDMDLTACGARLLSSVA